MLQEVEPYGLQDPAGAHPGLWSRLNASKLCISTCAAIMATQCPPACRPLKPAQRANLVLGCICSLHWCGMGFNDLCGYVFCIIEWKDADLKTGSSNMSSLSADAPQGSMCCLAAVRPAACQQALIQQALLLQGWTYVWAQGQVYWLRGSRSCETGWHRPWSQALERSPLTGHSSTQATLPWLLRLDEPALP